jgi:hypothetical protein
MQSITLPLILSLVTTVISGVFAGMVLLRWRRAVHEGKQRPHLRAWGIGLALYCLGALCQVILCFVWSPPVFALWYWIGALAVAPWLGQGTVYLLLRRGSIARNIEMALLLVCVMTLPWALLLTPMDGSAWKPGLDVTSITSEVLQRGGVRAFVPVMNVWGTIELVGGAIYSAVLFRRKQVLRTRMVGNWLIAAGGLLPALGGALVRLNLTQFNYLGIMLGVILIFVGYLKTANAPDDAKTVTPSHTAAETAGD